MCQIERRVLSDESSNTRWVRFTTKVTVPGRLHRAFKARNPTVEIAIAIPDDPQATPIYAGLPIATTSMLPFAVNAPFDPDTSRSRMQHVEWNQWLWKTLSALIGEVALGLLHEGDPACWRAIPLWEETQSDDEWVVARMESLFEFIKSKLVSKGRLLLQGGDAALTDIGYEAAEVDGLLDEADFKALIDIRPVMPKTFREGKRWREVLGDLELGKEITFPEVLELLSDHRVTKRHKPEWFVELTNRAINAELEAELESRPCVLTARGTLTIAGNSENGPLFVERQHPSGFADRLNLVHMLHPVYSFDSTSPTRTWLKDRGSLIESMSDSVILQALITQATRGAIAVLDSELIEIRQIFDGHRLKTDFDWSRLGHSILLDGYIYRGKTRTPTKIRVSEAYIPARIEGDPQGWPAAAKETEGIRWIAPRYASVLNPGRRNRAVSGAQRLLSAMGAMTSPRLVFAPAWTATEVTGLFPLQRRSIESSGPVEIEHDTLSPDLEAVVDSICKMRRGPQRRDRGLALFHTLAKAWGRHYAERAECVASYRGGAVASADIPASWLSALADGEWLSNEAGQPRAPRLLDVRTPLTAAIYGVDAAKRFAFGLGERDVGPLTHALGLQDDPAASAIVSELAQLRDSGATPEEDRLYLIYAYLADLCRSATDKATAKVDDLSTDELRGRFGILKTRPGLIWTGVTWSSPNAVLRGPAVFGKRRAFVRNTSRLQPLWKVLNIREPSTGDCIKVINEIAESPQLESTDTNILMECLRLIEAGKDPLTTSERNQLPRIPLWTEANQWERVRPVYLIDNNPVVGELSSQIPLWKPFVSFAEAQRVSDKLSVTPIKVDQCTPTGVTSQSPFLGEAIRPKFQQRLEALHAYLITHAPQAIDTLQFSWEALTNSEILIVPNLGLEIVLPSGRTVTSATKAHLISAPLAILVQAEEDLYSYESGARLIAECFSTYEFRELIRAAWSNEPLMDHQSIPFDLTEDETDDELDQPSLEELADRIRKNKGKSISFARQDPPSKTSSTGTTETAEEPPRRLKQPEGMTISSITIVGGAKRNRRATRRQELKKKLPPAPPVGSPTGRQRTRRRAYSDHDREQLALRFLQEVIRSSKHRLLRDYTKRHGIGADAVEDLKRFFEVKAYAGPDFPNEVDFQISEAERAKQMKTDFYLVVVVGLEKDYETRLRFIQRPLVNLELTSGSKLILRGIESAQSIEVVMSDSP